MSLNREQFFAAASFGSEEVDVPALGSTVFVRVMSAGDRDRFEEASTKDAHGDFRARLVVATAADASGALLFTKDDVPKVSALPSNAIDPIVQAALRVNRMRAQDLDDLAKN